MKIGKKHIHEPGRNASNGGRHSSVNIPVKLGTVAFALFVGVAVAATSYALPETLGSVILTKVSPRIATPNGDSANDVIHFKFDTILSGIPLETAVFDVMGAKVSDLALSSDETSLLWDGKDEDGRVVSSGIYFYSIKIGKSLATGTVVILH